MAEIEDDLDTDEVFVSKFHNWFNRSEITMPYHDLSWQIASYWWLAGREALLREIKEAEIHDQTEEEPK
jgi:hypothetical protein